MTAAPPDDKREPVINLSDGSFLTDLVWLTSKRAQGRVLFSLIEGAAEAVEHHLDMAESMMDELDGVAAQLDAELDAATGGDRDEDGASDPVEDFIERVNNGEITELSLLDFDKLEDFQGVLGEELDEDDFQHHRAVMDEIIEEARVRGIPVSRVTASQMNIATGCPASRSGKAGWKPSRLSPSISGTGNGRRKTAESHAVFQPC